VDSGTISSVYAAIDVPNITWNWQRPAKRELLLVHPVQAAPSSQSVLVIVDAPSPLLLATSLLVTEPAMPDSGKLWPEIANR
jgi:hypothetical protein